VTDKNQSVAWPAVLKHSGDDELIYISSAEKWQDDTELHQAEYDQADVLIDSAGAMFSLVNKQGDYTPPEFRDERMSLEELLGLVKAHAAQQGSCCVAKLYAATISDAFKIVKSLDEA